jgi:hypothetical protein
VIHLFHLAGNAAVWVALVSALMFCATYALVAPWRSTGEGWHLMTFTGVIGAIFAWIAYRQVLGSPTAPLSIEAPRAAAFTAMAGLLVWRLVLLIRTQVRRRKRR